jgi:biopolymer transport protein ExbD
MAELNQAASAPRRERAGVRRLKKQSTRVDLTPMVDLGFLLITFFIFTTSLSEPRVLKMALPKDVPDINKQTQPESGVLTLLPGSHDQVYYYERADPESMRSVAFSGIRSVILSKKVRTRPNDFMVIVKAGPECSFKNVVNILDEMAINGVKHYAMVDISAAESGRMHQLESR